MRNLSVTCFGVGDGQSCADRNHASFLYRLGKTTLLLDCGEPIDRSLTERGLDYNSIDGIVISHLHSDHVGGLFMLMQGMWLQTRRRELPIYLPGSAIKPIRAMFDAVLLFDELMPFRRKMIPLAAAKALKIGEARITPFPTTHLESIRALVKSKSGRHCSAFCFLIEAGKLRIGHSADLGKPEDLEPLLSLPLDLLICELSHFAPEEIFTYLRGRKIKKVVFAHLGQPHWENQVQLRRLGKRMLPDVPHVFARDGEVIAV